MESPSLVGNFDVKTQVNIYRYARPATRILFKARSHHMRQWAAFPP